MFGVVPKPLWQRRIPADERNRIPLALRCLLVEHDDGLVLVDTGLGNKEDDKFKDIYGWRTMERRAHPARRCARGARLRARRRPLGDRQPLHFDHAGAIPTAIRRAA